MDWLSTEEASPALRKCVDDITRIVDGYGQAVNSEGQNETTEGQGETQEGLDAARPDDNKPWQVVWQDLAFVQGQCSALYEAKVGEIASRLKEYKGEAASQAGELASIYAEQKNDQKAIESFRYLVENFPQWKKDPAVLRQYGEVLLRQGKLREASAIFNELPQDPAAIKQTLALYRKSADLLLAVGKLDEAARKFHAIKEIEQAAASGDEAIDASLDLLERQQKKEPLLSIYQNFLGEYYSYDGKNFPAKANTTIAQLKSSFPASPLTENAERLYAEMMRKTRAVVEGQLAAAFRLADEQKYDQAKETLTAISTDGLPADLTNKIRFSLQEITFNEQEAKKSSAWEDE
ncbi:MAG: hypothetical protein P8130_08670, partial [Deltaproteobacteria bacterium]